MARRSNGRWTAAKIRKLRGTLTKREFGDALGVAASTVWWWEKGLHHPIQLSREALDAFDPSQSRIYTIRG